MNLRINTLEEKITKLENEIAEEAIKIVHLNRTTILSVRFNKHLSDNTYSNSIKNVIGRHEAIVTSKLEIIREYKYEIREIKEREEGATNE